MRSVFILTATILFAFNPFSIADSTNSKGDGFITDKVMSVEEEPDYSDIKNQNDASTYSAEKQKHTESEVLNFQEYPKGVIFNVPTVIEYGQISTEEIMDFPKPGKARSLSDLEKMRQLESTPLAKYDKQLFLLDGETWIRSRGEYEFHLAESATDVKGYVLSKQAKLVDQREGVEYDIIMNLKTEEDKSFIQEMGITLIGMDKEDYFRATMNKAQIFEISNRSIKYAMYPEYPGDELNMNIIDTPDEKYNTSSIGLEVEEVIFLEDFEGSFPGNWSVGDDDPGNGLDYWDDLSCKSHWGSWSGWCADIGDMPDCGNYDDDMSAYMISPVINVSGYTNVSIGFYYLIEMENNYDFLDCYMREVGGPWYNILHETGSSNNQWWGTSVGFSGFNNIEIKFVFSSDFVVNNYEGAYIDDIRVEGTPSNDYAVIYDAWWTNEIDIDGDGYVSRARLNWDPDVADCNGSLQVFERIFWRSPCGSGERTFFFETNPHTITNCWTSDSYWIEFNGWGHNTFDWQIAIYRVGQSVPDDIRDDVFDSDLSCYEMEHPILDNFPDIAVSPTSHNYGSVNIASYSDFDFYITNTGPGGLNVSTQLISGPNSGDFSIISGGGGFYLAPGGTTPPITIRFTPSAMGSRTATWQVYSNDPDENPLNVPLSGTGIGPDIAISPTSHNYGDVDIGSYSDFTFTVFRFHIYSI
jgi:hypothetical protein